ncbi:MAG: TraR/DksA family transcriptional regulator [Rhodobacteraceae bacterium]|nr:TraR/DksA family transcriptional regulator [Paracoccaceae bacterium]
MTDVSARKRQLVKRQSELDARLHEIDDSLDEMPSKDWEDRASEREDDEVLEQVGLSGQKELQMISAALARIEAGTYGYCTQCGAQIREDRLDLMPSTPFCRNCAI